jgi:hypothetical protein
MVFGALVVGSTHGRPIDCSAFHFFPADIPAQTKKKVRVEPKNLHLNFRNAKATSSATPAHNYCGDANLRNYCAETSQGTLNGLEIAVCMHTLLTKCLS